MNCTEPGNNYRKLEVDDNWKVQIPVDLRSKVVLSENKKWVDVYFDFSNGDYDFEELIVTLLHDGVIICP